MSLSLNNTEEIIANSIYLIQGNDIIDILDLISNATGGVENNTYTKSQIDGFLNLKRNLIDSYSIIQTNNLLNNKLDVSVFNTQIALKRNILDSYSKTEVNTSLALKANQATTYTKTEVDTSLGLKRNILDSYSKTEVDTSLSLKRNILDSYSKTEINTSLALKRDITDSYSKTEVDTSLALKANITNVFQKQLVDNETFMILNNKFRYKITNDKVILQFYDEAGTIITDTWIVVLSFNVDDNLNQITYSNIYTKSEVDTAIANIVNSAPETLNTLNELAAALGNDPNFATTISNQIGLKANQATTYTKTEVDTALASKRNVLDSYTKTEVNTSLALKANQATTYTKTEVDTSLGLKRNIADSYTKAEVDTSLALKRNVLDSYSKTEVDNSLNLKRNIADSYSKTEINTSLALKSNITDVFQKQIVDNDTFMILNNKFRYKITNDKIVLQFYDEAGTLITDTWLDLLSFNVDDNLNQITYSNIYTKSEVDNMIANINSGDLSNYYTKTEVDNSLNLKANQSTTYSKTETDTLLNTKANSVDVYSKTQIDNALISYYNKVQTDNLIDAPKLVLKTAMLEFYDVNSLGINSLLIKGGTYINITDSSNNQLINMSNVSIDFNKTTNFYSPINIKRGGFDDRASLFIISNTDKPSDFMMGSNNKQLWNWLCDDSNGTFTASNSLSLWRNSNPSNSIYTDTKVLEIDRANGNISVVGNLTANNLYSKTDIDNILISYYTKVQTENLVNVKANVSDVYHKNDTYTKTEVDTALNLKANQATTYTKNEVDNIISNTNSQERSDWFLNRIEGYGTNYIYGPTGRTAWGLGTGSYTNIILNATYGSIYAQTLSLNNNYYNMYVNIQPGVLLIGATVRISLFIELGTATNFILVTNNGSAFDTMTNNYIVYTDNSPGFKNISLDVVVPSTGQFNIHIGANAETSLNSVVQSTGTVTIYDLRVEQVGVTFNDPVTFNQPLSVSSINGNSPVLTIKNQSVLFKDQNNDSMVELNNLAFNSFKTFYQYGGNYADNGVMRSQFQMQNLVDGKTDLALGTNGSTQWIHQLQNSSSNYQYTFWSSANGWMQIYNIDYSTGNMQYNYTIYQSSDIKLKDNIEDASLSECKYMLDNINAKTYTRKDMNNAKRIGFIAQDIDKYKSEKFENLSSKSLMNDKDGNGQEEILVMDYSRLTAVLWTIVKDQQKTINDIQNRLNVLESEI